MTKYKCKKCGRGIETFREGGKYAAACSNGACMGAYEYDIFDTEEELFEYLENSNKAPDEH